MPARQPARSLVTILKNIVVIFNQNVTKKEHIPSLRHFTFATYCNLNALDVRSFDYRLAQYVL
jgi:hypothetical protein